MQRRKGGIKPYKTNPRSKGYPRSRKKNKSSAGRAFMVLLALIVLLPSVFITLNENYFKLENVPDWNNVFGYFGLNKNTPFIPDVDVTIEGSVSVHYINVGQGDCEFIQTPEYNILIDSGEKENFQTVINYLKSNGVDRLDYVVATHPHSDHIGGLSFIMAEIETIKVIMPEVQESQVPVTSSYERLINAIIDNDCEVIYAEPSIIELDNGIMLEIIAPVRDYDDLNNYSIVMKLIHGKNKFLFTGDIENKAEDDILKSGADLTASVLKVAHHGSATSSKADFLNQVNGRYAVIGVGSPNTYNHPTDSVLERLFIRGYTVLRTDINGNIIFYSDGKQISVYAEKEYIDSNNAEGVA